MHVKQEVINQWPHFRASLLNILLRGLTLAAKFFLLVYLVRVLPPEEIGIYGLVTVTISYSLYLLGLDFYTYSTRKMLSKPREDWPAIIRDQFVFYGVVYLLALPFALLLFFSGIMPWELLGWFYVLLTLEHVSQELYRLLVAIQRPLLAGCVFFLRNGAWAYVVIVIMWQHPTSQDLSSIWSGWAIGVGASVLLALVSLRNLAWSSTKDEAVDWKGIRRGVRIAFPFLLGTLALRGIFTFDRFIIDHYWGKELLGVYTFYMGIANAVQAFVDAGVIMHLYPKIIAAYRQGRINEYQKLIRKMAIGIVLSMLVLTVCAIGATYMVLDYIQEPIYSEHINILWILLASSVVMSLGMVPHYALYAMQSDLVILYSSIGGFVVMLLMAGLFAPQLSSLGVPFSVLSAILFISLAKLFFHLKSEKVRKH